jgi:hypothetical protein
MVFFNIEFEGPNMFVCLEKLGKFHDYLFLESLHAQESLIFLKLRKLFVDLKVLVLPFLDLLHHARCW